MIIDILEERHRVIHEHLATEKNWCLKPLLFNSGRGGGGQIDCEHTSPSSQLHQLPPAHPSVTGEKDDAILRCRHHYLGAEPLVFWKSKTGIFLQFDQEKLSQRHAGFHSVGSCLWGTVRGGVELFKQVLFFYVPLCEKQTPGYSSDRVDVTLQF